MLRWLDRSVGMLLGQKGLKFKKFKWHMGDDMSIWEKLGQKYTVTLRLALDLDYVNWYDDCRHVANAHGTTCWVIMQKTKWFQLSFNPSSWANHSQARFISLPLLNPPSSWFENFCQSPPMEFKANDNLWGSTLSGRKHLHDLQRSEW